MQMTIRRTIGILISALALLVPGVPAFPESIDGRTIILRMLDAEGAAVYSAYQVTVLNRNRSVRSEQIVYRSGFDGMRMEYNSPPVMDGEIMVDDGRVLTHLIPRTRVVRTGPSRLAELKVRTSEAEKAHRKGRLNVQYLGRERVAGRDAYVVQVTAGQRKSPTRKFWVDTDEWVKLKTQDIAPDGAVQSTSYYTRIDYLDSIPDSKFRVEVPDGYRVDRKPGGGESLSLDEARKEVPFRILEPKHLPRGFKAVGVKVIPFRRGQMVAIRYTDGVTSFSLFQTQERFLDRKFLDRLNEGPVQPGRGIHSWRQGGLNLTLVGKLSQDQLEKIAESVK